MPIHKVRARELNCFGRVAFLCDAMDCSQVLGSVGSSRQEYCSGLSRPSPEDFPEPGTKSASPALQADF